MMAQQVPNPAKEAVMASILHPSDHNLQTNSASSTEDPKLVNKEIPVATSVSIPVTNVEPSSIEDSKLVNDKDFTATPVSTSVTNVEPRSIEDSKLVSQEMSAATRVSFPAAKVEPSSSTEQHDSKKAAMADAIQKTELQEYTSELIILEEKRLTELTDSTDAEPLSEFTCFKELPIELRLRIWRTSMPDSRLVEIFWDSSTPCYYTNVKTPAILHVCAESREEALKHYELLEIEPDQDDAFSRLDDKYLLHKEERQLAGLDVSMMRRFRIPVPKMLRVYINYKVDMIYLGAIHYRSDAAEIQPQLVEFIVKLKNALSDEKGVVKHAHVAVQASTIMTSDWVCMLLPLFYQADFVDGGEIWLDKVNIVFGDEGINEFRFVDGILGRNGKVLDWQYVKLDDTRLIWLPTDHPSIRYEYITYDEQIKWIWEEWKNRRMSKVPAELELVPMAINRDFRKVATMRFEH